MPDGPPLLMGQSDSRIRALVRTTERPLPGTETTITTRVVTPILPGETLAPQVGEDGEATLAILRPFDGHGTGYWGCAICEQLHPVEISACPLAEGPTREVLLGPAEFDGQTVGWLARERA